MKNGIKALRSILFLMVMFLFFLGISSVVYGDEKDSDGYTDEQKAAAKAWLSSHGYAPTRAGANQAYQDYLNGKFDNDPEVQKALGKTVTTEEKKEVTTTETITEADSEEAESEENETDEETYVVPDDELTSTETDPSDNKRSENKISENKKDEALEDKEASTEADSTDMFSNPDMLGDSNESSIGKIGQEIESDTSAEESLEDGDIIEDETSTEDRIWLLVLILTGSLAVLLIVFGIIRKLKKGNKEEKE